MSISTDIRSYSDHWMELAERFNEHPEEEYVVHCSSVKEAMKVRLEWYKARSAIQREERMLDAQTYKEMGHPNLNRKECVIRGNDVHFVYKEYTPTAALLRKSLEEHKKDQA